MLAGLALAALDGCGSLRFIAVVAVHYGGGSLPHQCSVYHLSGIEIILTGLKGDTGR